MIASIPMTDSISPEAQEFFDALNNALDTGAVVTDGPASEVLAHPQVVASYLGEAAS